MRLAEISRASNWQESQSVSAKSFVIDDNKKSLEPKLGWGLWFSALYYHLF